MRRINSQTENRIVELWFKGIPRDAIARRVAVSGSTVSGVVNRLPESLRELRALSVELRKSNASLPEAIKGAKLLSKLASLGVDPDQIQSFIHATNKLCRRAEYQPNQVVQSAMKLSDLEEKSGKSYFEAIEEFEAKTRQTKELEARNLKLQVQIEKKEGERKQKLKLDKITEREIEYIKELRQAFRKHRINLTDTENLKTYLENMRETGGNPRKFVEYTRKMGSFKGRLTYLENQKQLKISELKIIKEDAETARNEASRLQTNVNSLQGKREEAAEDLEKLKIEVVVWQEKREAEILSLAKILKVRADVEEINKAKDVLTKELHDFKESVENKKIAFEGIQSQTKELERKKQDLEHEVEGILKIKSYALETKKAIADLERENAEKRDRFALADTLANFLLRVPTYDFNRFYSMAEDVKRARENKSSPLRPLIPRIEESIRMQALKAFEGDLVSKWEFRALWNHKEELRKENNDLRNKVGELEKKLKEKDDELANLRKDREVFDKIKVNFEGRQMNLEELRRLIISIYEEEIERRANEKFDRLAAVTHGGLDWLERKITKKDNQS